MKEGPTVYTLPERSFLTCIRCDHLKEKLIRSGRDPQWECQCMHPRAEAVAKQMPVVEAVWSRDGKSGCFIGEQPDTPDWCPLKKDNLTTKGPND